MSKTILFEELDIIPKNIVACRQWSDNCTSILLIIICNTVIVQQFSYSVWISYWDWSFKDAPIYVNFVYLKKTEKCTIVDAQI